MNRLESHESDHSVVGGAALHDLAAAKKLAERKLRLGDFSQCLSPLCPPDRAGRKNSPCPSEQGRDDAAYSGKTGNWDDAIAMHPG